MTLPKAEAEPERYRGRPLLIVLESYVLAALGYLSPEQDASLRAIVQRVFGGDDDWMGTVRQRLKLLDSLDESLRGMWALHTVVALDAGIELAPMQFAKMIVDSEFAHLVGPPPS